jgi:hypothetical protein
LTGDVRAVVTALRRRNAAERAGQGAFSLFDATPTEDILARSMAAVDRMRDDELTDIAVKKAQWQSVVDSEAMRRGQFAADAWCAAFVVAKDAHSPEITTATIRRVLDHGLESLDARVVETVTGLADEYRFLHVHTTFPQVFDDATTFDTSKAGFDVVLGNPPWDQIQYDPREVFAQSHPDIANAPTMAARERMIASLAESAPDAFEAHLRAQRKMEGAQQFIHGAGRFPLSSFGRLNTAPLFVELMRTLAGRAGMVGVIVPSGIATDSFNQYLFQDLVANRSLVSLYDFENSAGVFPAVHRSFKFCLLTLTGAERPTEDGAKFAFFCHQTSDLRDDGRRFSLAPEELLLVNPNTQTCPIFRSRREADLTLGIYRKVPVLVADGPPEVNPWDVQLQLMFMMNAASNLFQKSSDCELAGATMDGNIFRHPDGRTWLPLYEGKMVGMYDHRAADVVISPTAMVRQGQPDYLSARDHEDPYRVSIPRYWVSSTEVDERLLDDRQWLLAFCDITSSTNERTMVTCVIPRSAAGDNLPLLLPMSTSPHTVLLTACLSSFVFDFVARQKVGGTHLRFFTVKQLPVLPPQEFGRPAPWNLSYSLTEWITLRVLELTYVAWDLAGYARDLGYEGPPFIWEDARRTQLRAELDACFFHLYGIDRDDVAYIMDTFPIVRRHDETAYGEYRTARLILACYDAMTKAMESGVPYRGALE